MLVQLTFLVFLDYFNSSMLNALADQNLKNGLHFVFIIKQVWITLENLSLLSFTLGVGDENCSGRPVDVVVGINVVLVHHVLVVTEFFPHIRTLHLGHLHILLLLHFALLLAHALLGLSALAHLLLTLLHVGLFHPLFFYQGRIGLHVDRDDKGSKCVATHHPAVIHNILRSHLTVEMMKMRKLKLVTYMYSRYGSLYLF